MRVSWRIEDGLVWLQSVGPWTLDDWRDAVEAVLDHPEYRLGMGAIDDRRRVELSPRISGPDEARTATHYLETRQGAIGNARWGLVVSDSENYGMARITQAYLGGTSLSLRVFYYPRNAEAWVRESG